MKRSPRITLFPPNLNAESTYQTPRPERHSSRIHVSSDERQSTTPPSRSVDPIRGIKVAQAAVRPQIEKLNQGRIYETPTKHEQDQQRLPDQRPSGRPSSSSSKAVKTQPIRAPVAKTEQAQRTQRTLARSKSVQDLRLSAGGGVSEMGAGKDVGKESIEQVREDAGWCEEAFGVENIRLYDSRPPVIDSLLRAHSPLRSAT